MGVHVPPRQHGGTAAWQGCNCRVRLSLSFFSHLLLTSNASFTITIKNHKVPGSSIRREYSSIFPLGDTEGCGDRRLIASSRLSEESGFLKKVPRNEEEFLFCLFNLQGMLQIEVSFFLRRQAWVV